MLTTIIAICRRQQHHALLFCLTLLLGACQLPPPWQPAQAGPYYLWLKTLSPDEIAQEIARQQRAKDMGNTQAELNLLLLYSVPNSPKHNPYSAKAMLNQQAFWQQLDSHLTAADMAILTLLKDQLNEQLLILQQVQQQSAQHDRDQQKLALQQQQLAELEQKMKQLQKIETAITQHGQ